MIPMAMRATAAMLMLASALPVLAQDDSPYLIGGGLFELSDTKRDSDDGYGLELGLGLPLPDFDGAAVEFTLKAVQRDGESGDADKQYSLFGNFVQTLQDVEFVGGGAPYFLAGLGVVQEDVNSEDHTHFGLDAGAGLRWPLPIGQGWSLRTEAVAQAQANDKSVPAEDYLLDFHFRLGLAIPLGESSAPLEEAAVPEAPECPVKVVDPVTGRSDCATDSDHDGVVDGTDLCPATPAGTAVDAAGCTVGGVVDSDGDGVLDDVDACPSTTSGMIVDGTGCLVDQTVTLRAVRFETASARLTPDARLALEEVARALKSQRALKAEILGHTDDQGNDNFNLQLSQERAESVRQYLIGKSVAPERLSALGLGETQPVAGNDTLEGRDANRRVEFRVRVQ